MKITSQALFIAVLAGLIPAAAPCAEVSYNEDIRPILADHCFACHGPDENTRKADLRLGRFDSATAVRASGPPAIVPGDWAASALAQRVETTNPDDLMPPPDAGKPLSKTQIALLRAWIDAGAEYETHWSYVPPVRPSISEVSDEAWPRSNLDRFVLARLDREGLAPSPEADKHTLIRRLYLDLIGLPPSIEEVDAFVADSSPFAYEKIVNQLLASPRFGEHWARMWLDLARYADTKGYQKDLSRTIWPYRDWVIDAFNRDLPFDQFTIEQIAGDLLPSPTQEQIIATAFHRNTMDNDEGGTDDEEFRVAAVVDRVNTTMTVWMGTTMECAQCHDHKYDPISQKEYYQLFDFFNQTADTDHESERPTLKLPAVEQDAEHKRLLAIFEEAKNRLHRAAEAHVAGEAAWIEENALKVGAPTDFLSEDDLYEALAEDSSERTDDQERLIRLAYYESIPTLYPLCESLSEAQDDLSDIEEEFPAVPIMSAVNDDERRQSHVHVRGNFLDLGEPTSAGVPEVFHPLTKPTNAPDRLDLAKWLVERDNPLSARVFVNRVWERLYGIGLVETSQGFGIQGNLPSHPDLLDWLAVEFMEDGWSLKELLQEIVQSATYRQRSTASQNLLERDPYNRLLARGARFRLDAEVIRDQALASSGLLSHKMYGPSVMPPQPEAVWADVYSGDEWVTSEGEDRYRRGLYTFWRRTSPYPSMATFDAVSREVCTESRSRSNTPLQALVTLNDPVYIEAAQALARRMALEIQGSISEQIEYGFRCVLVRPPSEEEHEIVSQVYRSELEHYQTRPEKARLIATEPLGNIDGVDYTSLAAWTVVANVLLNLDELVMSR
jgi:hypothetical protein